MDVTTCTLSDNELISLYREGNCECFDILLDRYQTKVYGYILSVVKEKEAAEDIFQDTFYKVVYTISNGLYRDENRFINWVMRIAHNQIVDYFRRQSKMPLVANRPEGDLVDNLKLEGDNAEKEIISKQTSINVRKLIKLLPPEQRRVVILRLYGKCDYREIAERTHVSINTALGRMRYATLNLRRLARENHMVIEL